MRDVLGLCRELDPARPTEMTIRSRLLYVLPAISLPFLSVLAAAPATAQTTVPSGVWTTTTSDLTVSATSNVPSGGSPQFAVTLTQSTTSYPLSVTASVGAGTSSFSYLGQVYQINGLGLQGPNTEPQQGYIVGPALDVTIVSPVANTVGTVPAGSPIVGILAAVSLGADGAATGTNKTPGGGSYNAGNGGNGGNISISQQASLTLSVGPGPAVGTMIGALGSAIGAYSRGGVGSDPYIYDYSNVKLGAGGGGDGGSISIGIDSGQTTLLQSVAGSPGTVNAVTAISLGGQSGAAGITFAASGNVQAFWGSPGAGGAVQVAHSGLITELAPVL